MSQPDNKPLMDDPTPPAYSTAVPSTAPPPPYTTQPITQTNVTVITTSFRDYPVRTICNVCSYEVISRVHYDDGILVWLSAGVICLLGGWLGCFLIPFCIDGLKDCTHFCPNCGALLGKYERLR
ncbi:lipopolysaccharide-induced tumor necrosis factor-alpha factor homolog [Saccoglossus kowalevskii]|uniref:Lipopolysaccharide-induced tumor necrosis factor-alpha factor homolog n=1 Tax=Saccoglossus kowalevskii TaxID=10224 RepID=A0ABM0GXN1_SACKO|nr:PREDICTED: lipopolysaccharide-induced tumor necrosis factor-alpha factor homolog [Saccoglossus kowalevskii]